LLGTKRLGCCCILVDDIAYNEIWYLIRLKVYVARNSLQT
jgi:hypothetical protein